MSSPLLGDPASMSALGASLRRTALTLLADGERVTAALEDAAAGWRGPRSVQMRRRAGTVATQTRSVATTLDDVGRSLQSAATDLAEAVSHLRELEDAASALGLEVREGTVTRGWGITGVADAATLHDEERQRERLQERVHQAVTTLGRRRARLAEDLARAADLLAQSSADLRA